jgi:hypothetical protein
VTIIASSTTGIGAAARQLVRSICFALGIQRCAAAAARGSLSQLPRAAIRGMLCAMDPGLEKKLKRAFEAAVNAANETGMGREEAMRFIANYLHNHFDPDIRACQLGHEQHVGKDLN